MSEAATPAVPATEAPVVPAATPAQAQAETVTLPKEQHDQLARDAARAASNQRKADLYDKTVGSKGASHFAPAAPVTPPSKEEMETRASEEDRKAERGLLALAADPAFREVLDADPTLRNLILTNPLAVLPMFASDAVDAEDAITLVKEGLEKLKKPVDQPPAKPADVPPAPPAGVITPPNAGQTDEAYEAAKKNPNTEQALAGMIGAKIKAGNK